MGDCLEAISKHTLIPRLLTPKDLSLSLSDLTVAAYLTTTTSNSVFHFSVRTPATRIIFIIQKHDKLKLLSY